MKSPKLKLSPHTPRSRELDPNRYGQERARIRDEAIVEALRSGETFTTYGQLKDHLVKTTGIKTWGSAHLKRACFDLGIMRDASGAFVLTPFLVTRGDAWDAYTQDVQQFVMKVQVVPMAKCVILNCRAGTSEAVETSLNGLRITRNRKDKILGVVRGFMDVVVYFEGKGHYDFFYKTYAVLDPYPTVEPSVARHLSRTGQNIGGNAVDMRLLVESMYEYIRTYQNRWSRVLTVGKLRQHFEVSNDMLWEAITHLSQVYPIQITRKNATRKAGFHDDDAVMLYPSRLFTHTQERFPLEEDDDEETSEADSSEPTGETSEGQGEEERGGEAEG